MEDLLKQGEALFAEGKLEEAEKCFLSLLDQNPEDAEALNNLGVIYHTRGNVQEAEGYFIKAVEAKEDYPDALLNLADLYQATKRWEEAALQLEKSIAIDDQDPNLYNQLGMIYLEMGNIEKARIALKKSLELNPDQETVRESLKELEKRDLAPNYFPTPGSFRGAFAEINITPNVSEQNPVFLQGMGGPPRKATAISTPLMMQMFLLEDDHFTKVLFITADLFGFGSEIVDGVRALAAQWRIEPEGLILNASHTHYAPGTISHASKLIGPFYEGYAKQIVQTIAQQLPILYDKLEECELSWGKVEAQIGVSRRLKKDGKVVFAPNPEGYYDKDTPFFLLYMLKTDKKVLLVNHGCHPTGLGSEVVISADYPGYMRNALKSSGVVDGVMFLQGGAGSTKESVCINGKVRFCENSTEAKEKGEFLATQIMNGLEKGLQPVEGSFFCTRRHISLPLKPAPPPNILAQVRNNQDTDALVREWASSLLNRFPNGDIPDSLAMEIQLVSLGDKVSFVTLPGEPVAELARDLRRLTSNPDSTFVLGYTNGLIGYLPTDVMIEEGGYETEGSQFAYLLPSALNTGTESAIISATEQCVSAAENRGRPNGYGRYHLAKKKQKAFFVLSAGRCGTMTLAHLLNTATNAKVWHHPQPDPIKESLLAYWGEIDKRKAFWKARYPIIHKTWSEGLIHGETDLLMTSFCDMIANEIQDSKFIVLVRDPRDFVRSGMRRNYYYGHPWDFGRLRPKEGTEEFERWSKLDQFGKVCWLWHKTYEKTNRIIDQLGRDRVITVRFENLVEGIEKTEELFNFLGLEGFNSENIKKLLSRRFNEQVTGTFPKPKDWSEKLNETLWNLCGIIANHFGYQDTYEKKNSDSSISTNQQCLSSNTHNSEDPQFTGQRSTVDAACIRADIPNNLHKFLQANRHKSTSKHLSQDDIFIHLCRKLNITKHGYTSDKIPFVETANGLIFFGLPNHKDINKLYTNLNDGIKNCFPKDISAIIFEVGSRFFNDAQHKRYTYRKGDVVVELGAYLGYYSMNAAQKIGPSGRIIAVEFVPENYEILYKNLSVNFPDNAQAILKGVSNKKGRKKIYAGGDQVNSFRQDIVSRFRTDFATIEIETDTVDNILKENDINKVDLMIMQLNGNELDALMGIKDSMAIIDNFAIAAPYELDGQSSRKIVDEFLRRNGFATEVSDVWVYAKRKRSCLQKVGRNVCQPNCIRSNERGETGSDYKDTISVEEAISINMDNSLGQAAKNGNEKGSYALAVKTYCQGNFVEAVSICENILRETPGQSCIHAMIGCAFLKLKQEKNALKHLDKAFKYDPDRRLFQQIGRCIATTPMPQKEILAIGRLMASRLNNLGPAQGTNGTPSNDRYINVFGTSHVRAFGGHDHFFPLFIGVGRTMLALNETLFAVTRQKILNHLRRVDSRQDLLLIFGGDPRFHFENFANTRSGKEEYMTERDRKVMRDTVERYGKLLKEISSQITGRLILYNALPTFTPLVNKFTCFFNEALKTICKNLDVYFLDIYKKVIDENTGMLREELKAVTFKGDLHLGSQAFPIILRELQRLQIIDSEIELANNFNWQYVYSCKINEAELTRIWGEPNISPANAIQSDLIAATHNTLKGLEYILPQLIKSGPPRVLVLNSKDGCVPLSIPGELMANCVAICETTAQVKMARRIAHFWGRPDISFLGPDDGLNRFLINSTFDIAIVNMLANDSMASWQVIEHILSHGKIEKLILLTLNPDYETKLQQMGFSTNERITIKNRHFSDKWKNFYVFDFEQCWSM